VFIALIDLYVYIALLALQFFNNFLVVEPVIFILGHYRKLFNQHVYPDNVSPDAVRGDD